MAQTHVQIMHTTRDTVHLLLERNGDKTTQNGSEMPIMAHTSMASKVQASINFFPSFINK